MADIVILGAGITGISTAYHLEKQNYFDYAFFEKDTTVGGLCRSIAHDGFTFDYTGHLLHINDDYFRTLIAKEVGFEHFNSIDRRSFIYSHDTYTPYPFQINLHGLPPDVIVECITEFVQRPRKKKIKNFRDWVLVQFGAGIGKHFFFPYQQKIFDFPITKLSASWTGRFVPATSLEALLHGALHPVEKKVGYNAQFFYPKSGGIFFWVHKLFQTLKKPVATQCHATEIHLKTRTIIFSNGRQESYKTLVSTLPLSELLKIVKEPSDSFLSDAQKKLKCTRVVNFNIGINRTDLSDKHWIYFPESKIPFYRIGFSHNFSKNMVPEGCSSLYGEIGFYNRSRAFQEQTLQRARAAAQKICGIDPHEIVTEKIIDIPHAYVVFDAWRDAHIEKIHAALAHYGIYSIGRYGAWKYASMQEGILDGRDIVEKIIPQSTPHIQEHHHAII